MTFVVYVISELILCYHETRVIRQKPNVFIIYPTHVESVSFDSEVGPLPKVPRLLVVERGGGYRFSGSWTNHLFTFLCDNVLLGAPCEVCLTGWSLSWVGWRSAPGQMGGQCGRFATLLLVVTFCSVKHSTFSKKRKMKIDVLVLKDEVCLFLPIPLPSGSSLSLGYV